MSDVLHHYRLRRDGVGAYRRQFASRHDAVAFIDALGVHDPVELLGCDEEDKVIYRETIWR